MTPRPDRRLAWRERFPDEVTCVRCLDLVAIEDTDRLLWCAACRFSARARAGRIGLGVAIVVALGLAVWIAVQVQPSDTIIGGWIGVVIAGGWFGHRITREIVYGVERVVNRRAVEAVPPVDSRDANTS